MISGSALLVLAMPQSLALNTANDKALLAMATIELQMYRTTDTHRNNWNSRLARGETMDPDGLTDSSCLDHSYSGDSQEAGWLGYREGKLTESTDWRCEVLDTVVRDAIARDCWLVMDEV